uniref:BHLH domain-containing protein n=1 Tax=Ananas comosus var. bracteatus TaxID=296719 RepID=A0A6V7QJI2_ANACO|nr:unnamed protein product [Ananas comosus var. bracteatus]
MTGEGGEKGGVGRGAPEAKTAMALKNHSEAERRRRERINSHLATLRTMVPCSDKMDKAAILAQVINHVKELKSKAVEISKGYNIPSDTDEVRVEAEANAVNSGGFYIRATLCCEDRPELFAELRQTLDTLRLKLSGQRYLL